MDILEKPFNITTRAFLPFGNPSKNSGCRFCSFILPNGFSSPLRCLIMGSTFTLISPRLRNLLSWSFPAFCFSCSRWLNPISFSRSSSSKPRLFPWSATPCYCPLPVYFILYRPYSFLIFSMSYFFSGRWGIFLFLWSSISFSAGPSAFCSRCYLISLP